MDPMPRHRIKIETQVVFDTIASKGFSPEYA
jgi:hypothetical protein